MEGGNMLSTIIGSIIGIVGSLLGGWAAYWLEKRNQKRFAATVLYNDLKSIERYLESTESDVNLRYSNNWQDMVADCSFLKNNNIKKIYIIYDEVYNFNYKFQFKEKERSFKKEDIDSYQKIKSEMSNSSTDYKELIEILQEHMK